ALPLLAVPAVKGICAGWCGPTEGYPAALALLSARRNSGPRRNDVLRRASQSCRAMVIVCLSGSSAAAASRPPPGGEEIRWSRWHQQNSGELPPACPVHGGLFRRDPGLSKDPQGH